ncbi:AraC family transcriptional regulator [Chitinophaga sp. Cy-1792]|uniref:helix-turn-helix domain-containing protein n=1 Tax=Chitinophaga sp. Cy-1792 TaxID=2608339 RepID=UPI00142494E9|nr:AraC family transcriptional regulator [Chitinophaga sp. Cy-1792]NIG53417.1 helix-turn-helix transcriptional regulator [Chitinophaga sp. Cy-1792]
MSIELFNIDQGYAVFSKSDYETRIHSHYAIEVVCCMEGTFSVTTDKGSYTNLTNVIIPSNLRHSFSCLKASCSLLFLDPLSDMGRYFARQLIQAGTDDIATNVPFPEAFHENGKFNFSALPRERIGNNVDDRIIVCIEMIDRMLTKENITLSALSRAVFLSEGRLSHLFKKETGIAVQQYIRWRKILYAAQQSQLGYSLTECAYHVGFADSSHFNKAFYKMFGIKPFFVLKGG